MPEVPYWRRIEAVIKYVWRHRGWLRILSKIFTLQLQCVLFSQKDVFGTDQTASTDDDLLNNEYWSLVENGHGRRPLAGGD